MNLIISASLAGALAACGGDDGASVGGLSCSSPACGGDPVGVWTIEDSCIDGDFTVEECPELEVNSFSATQSGTVTVNADNTYELDTQTVGSVSVTFPASCFGGLLTDCAQLNDDDTTCTGDAAAACDCDVSVDETTVESGTWSVNGTEVTLDDGNGNAETSEFCVDGDAMSVITEDEGIRAVLLLSR